MDEQTISATEPAKSTNALETPDISDDLKELDFDLGANDEKPKTMEELVRVLRESGFFGGWKDRTDIGDTLEYARKLREHAETRDHE